MIFGALLSAFFAVAVAVVPGVPAPPGAVYEKELAKVAVERAEVEIKETLVKIDGDFRLTSKEKDELRKQVQALKIGFYTTSMTVPEVIEFYEKKFPGASFLSVERSLMADAMAIAADHGVPLPKEIGEKWSGKNGLSARLITPRFEVDVEDHLVDPRTGEITKKTVIMISSVD